MRRRLIGTGPWRLNGHSIYLLSGGVSYAREVNAAGRWLAFHAGGGSGGQVGSGQVLMQYRFKQTLTTALRELRLNVDCWRLSELGAGGNPAVADLVWQRPASRCFPTCNDPIGPLTAYAKDSSRVAQYAMQGGWTWAGIPGMEFKFNPAEGGGVLVTPWGHGEWGVVPSRGDVLFAEFAQKKHMLRFEKDTRAFVSTRCDDGEVVQGRGT